MQRLLMITIELPFPATSGGRMKSWNMAKYLSKQFDVSLVCPLKYGTDELNRFDDAIDLKVFHYDQVEISRSATNLAKSYIRGIPLNVFRSGSYELKQRVAEIADNFDIILLDAYESFQYLPPDYHGQVILHTHNATYIMWERYAKTGDSFPMRMAAKTEAERVKNYERKACQRADLVFASPNDIDNLCGLGVSRDKFRETFHLGDDSQLALPSIEFDKTEEVLLYVGTLNWEANIDGLLWFLEEVWPSVKAKRSKLRFDIAGGNPDPRIKAACEPLTDVNLLGFVEDLEPLFIRSRLFMAPLRFGSGIKVKVLNAMCRGLPVITTSAGAEGISATHMQHLSITDEPRAMSQAILNLLQDKSAWLSIEHSSRELIREKYTWERVLGYMVSEIKQLSVREAA